MQKDIEEHNITFVIIQIFLRGVKSLQSPLKLYSYFNVIISLKLFIKKKGIIYENKTKTMGQAGA